LTLDLVVVMAARHPPDPQVAGRAGPITPGTARELPISNVTIEEACRSTASS